MDNATKEYYTFLNAASNTINIIENTNTDHHTITGFMDWKEKRTHIIRLQAIAKTLTDNLE